MALVERPSILERMRRTLFVGSTPYLQEEPKAVVGPGAAMVEYGMPMTERTDSASWLKSAQKISHTGWPAVAERIVSGRASAVPWHLEDEEGNTVDKNSPPAYQAALALIESPYGTDFTKPTDAGMRLTQRGLWRLTLRHMGVVNVGFWYLSQPELLAGTPLETLYINPARMQPATDKRGNLIGWILDGDETYQFAGGSIRGIPLTLNEVVPFWLEPPDWGYFGVGLVEIATGKIRLNDYTDRFLSQTFATGGRRGSFIGPKADRMPDEVFDALVVGLRNVAESPDSAKRNIVSKGPLDITPQASTPTELQAYDVMSSNRDDILSIWGVPGSQAGVAQSAGLNSGESRKYDEAVLWQNAIHPRLDVLRETIQVYVLDRFKGLGIDVTLVLDEPSFDDEAPRYQLAKDATSLPLIDNERRALVGHDPWPDFDPVTGEPLGVAIRLPSDIILAAVGPSEESRPIPATTALPEDTALLEGQPPEPVAKGLRDEVERNQTPTIRDRVARVLREQRSAVLNRIAENTGHLLRRGGRLDLDAIWPRDSRRWDLELAAALVPIEADIALDVAVEIRKKLRPITHPQAKADETTEAAIRFVRERAGERITGMNETTRKAVIAAVRESIEEAIDEGLSVDEAAALLSDNVGSLTVWDSARSELIARTETMFAYNDAALQSYRAYDVAMVQALDGDYDAECAARNGSVMSIDDALSITDHPNGTLDWVPVLEGAKAGKLLPPTVQEFMAPPRPRPAGESYRMPELVINIPPPPATVVNVEAQPAPVVNVTVPSAPPTPVVIPPTEVTVNVPETNPIIVNTPPEAKAGPVQDVRIVDDVSPPKLKRVIRNSKGQIEGMVEGS